ncbi:MAG: hypothetical protein KBB56_15460 [Acidobacteria bacterium]|nr:hypothetical protein [Acidobacteriota bacterium]
MKHHLLLLLIGAACLTAAAAQDVGNPVRLVPKGHLGVGLQAGFIFLQDFEHYELVRTYWDGSTATDVKDAKFEDDEQFLVTLALGLHDRVNVNAGLGMTGRGRWLSEEAGVNDWEGTVGRRFLWYAGGKALLWKHAAGPELIAAVKYLRYTSRDVGNWVYAPDGSSAEALGWETDDTITYWQASASGILAWPVGRFAPYVGLGYCHSHFDLDGLWVYAPYPEITVAYDGRTTREKNLAVLPGVEVDLGDGWSFTVQGMFVSETSISAGVSYRIKIW